jgi:hypothetical protein
LSQISAAKIITKCHDVSVESCGKREYVTVLTCDETPSPIQSHAPAHLLVTQSLAKLTRLLAELVPQRVPRNALSSAKEGYYVG